MQSKGFGKIEGGSPMDIQALKATCRQVRRDIVTMCTGAGSGHPGGSLSCTEALVAL